MVEILETLTGELKEQIEMYIQNNFLRKLYCWMKLLTTVDVVDNLKILELHTKILETLEGATVFGLELKKKLTHNKKK